MYRLVQNTKALTEKRQGKSSVFYGHIFIREEVGVIEVPKYNYIPEDHWILEKLFYTSNTELTTRHTYEPLWAFIDPKTGGYQKPNLNAVLFLIESALKGPQSQLSDEERMQKEYEKFYELLGGNPTQSDALHSQEGVSLAGLNIPRG